MDKIRELLARLANPDGIPADELLAARLELAAEFKVWKQTDEALSDEGAELAVQIMSVSDAADKVIAGRETVMAERRAALDEMAEVVSPEAAGPEDEPEVPEGETPEVPAETAAPEAEVEVPEPELVNAAVEPTKRMPLAMLIKQQPEPTKPVIAEPRGPIIKAASNLNAFSAGQEITVDQAAEAMCERLDALSMSVGGENEAPQKLHAARVSWGHQYPDDRKILESQRVVPAVVDRKFAAVVGEYPGDPRAITPIRGNGLTATGGLCAPVTVRYELETVSVADRPLRAGLPSFNADRGGIQYNSPAHLVDILADAGSAALTTVTVANDVSAVTKTVQEVACGTLNTVQVRAIAERLQFSNFADRYNPERMKQFMQLARAAHSRLTERELFEDMQTASTLVNGGAVWVGATRQWFNNVIAAAAAQRYRHRMDDAYPLRIVLPTWFSSLVAIDLGLQSNGERTVLGDFDAMQVINRWLGVENIRPIWQKDDARTNNALGAGAPAFTSQTGAGATLNDFPGRMVSLLFPEGSFLFLDGGSLDFGIVRDSTLNAANRFQTFYEVFEGVAFVGVESLAIVTLVCANGQGIAGTTTAKCGGSGS